MVGSYQAGSLPFPGSEQSLSRADAGLGFGWMGDLTVAQGKPLQPQHGGRGSCLGGRAVDPGPQGRRCALWLGSRREPRRRPPTLCANTEVLNQENKTLPGCRLILTNTPC